MSPQSSEINFGLGSHHIRWDWGSSRKLSVTYTVWSPLFLLRYQMETVSISALHCSHRRRHRNFLILSFNQRLSPRFFLLCFALLSDSLLQFSSAMSSDIFLLAEDERRACVHLGACVCPVLRNIGNGLLLRSF